MIEEGMTITSGPYKNYVVIKVLKNGKCKVHHPSLIENGKIKSHNVIKMSTEWLLSTFDS